MMNKLEIIDKTHSHYSITSKSLNNFSSKSSKNGENNLTLDIEDNTNENYELNELTRKNNSLSIMKLDSISISPADTNRASNFLNHQFPFSNFKSQKEVGTQTMSLTECQVNTAYPNEIIENLIKLRPKSMPSNVCFSKLDLNFPRVKADVKSKNIEMCSGDGFHNNLKEDNLDGCDKQDLEVNNTLPSKNDADINIVDDEGAKFKSKKPSPTKSQSKNICSSDTSIKDENKRSRTFIKKSAKPEAAVMDKVMTEDVCNPHLKLTQIVDQLQDSNWEVCFKGLKHFSTIANGINWESEISVQFIPVINRKLVDFFRSSRSNLCRTAVNFSGEFFILAKSTKRPEFDEMVELLLGKTADPNHFIQVEANVALDKMAQSISIKHSIRAICAKGSTNKNPIIRSATARILMNICQQVGTEQILGAQANVRTRKCVLTNLAKFLLDKNIEPRRHAETLCRLLKQHKLFNAYFFKDLEDMNSHKITLRKILNNLN